MKHGLFGIVAVVAMGCMLPCAFAQALPSGVPPPVATTSLSVETDDEATKATVKKITEAPDIAGNWLDLIVLMCERRQASEAQRLIRYVEDTFNPPEGIREVLTLLKQSGCGSSDASQIQLSVASLFGYDNNVNQGSSNPLFDFGGGIPGGGLPLAPEFLPMGDRFGQLGAAIVAGTPRTVQVGFQVRKREFDRLHRFDTQAVSVAAEKDWLCQGSLCSLSASAGQLALGGRAYQAVASVHGSWSSHPERRGEFFTFEGDFAYQRFIQNASLNAWLYQARATYYLPVPAFNGQLQASISAGLDIPQTTRPGGQRQFGSIGAGGNHALYPAVKLDWFLLRQAMREQESYSPGLIDRSRAPMFQQASIALTRQLTSSQSIRIEWRRAVNEDTVSLFSYRSTALTVGWQWFGNIQ